MSNFPCLQQANVEIWTEKELTCYEPIFVEGNIGEVVRLKAKGARIIDFEDPQEVLTNEKTEAGILTANLSVNKGYHTVMAPGHGRQSTTMAGFSH